MAARGIFDSENALGDLLKNLPDTPVASALCALLEDQVLLREQYKITVDKLKKLEQMLEDQFISQEQAAYVEKSMKSIMSEFDEMKKMITQHIAEVQENAHLKP